MALAEILQRKELLFLIGETRNQSADLREGSLIPLTQPLGYWGPISARGATSTLLVVSCQHQRVPQSPQSCLQTGGRCWESHIRQMRWMHESSDGGSGWRTGSGGPPRGWRAYVLAGAGAAAAAAEAAGEERWKERGFECITSFSPNLPKFHLLVGLRGSF